MSRGNFLTLTDLARLRSWSRDLKAAFREMPYQVGSSLTRADFRDVDVRLCVHSLDGLPVDALVFNLAFSEWGRAVTGLQIDFQVQPFEEFHRHDGQLRVPLGLQRTAPLRRSEIAEILDGTP